MLCLRSKLDHFYRRLCAIEAGRARIEVVKCKERPTNHHRVAGGPTEESESELHECDVRIPTLGLARTAWSKKVQDAKCRRLARLDAIDVRIPCAILRLVANAQVDLLPVVCGPHVCIVDLMRCGARLKLVTLAIRGAATTLTAKIAPHHPRICKANRDEALQLFAIKLSLISVAHARLEAPAWFVISWVDCRGGPRRAHWRNWRCRRRRRW